MEVALLLTVSCSSLLQARRVYNFSLRMVMVPYVSFPMHRAGWTRQIVAMTQVRCSLSSKGTSTKQNGHAASCNATLFRFVGAIVNTGEQVVLYDRCERAALAKKPLL